MNEELEYKFESKGYLTGSKLLTPTKELIEIKKILENTEINNKEKLWICTKNRLIKTSKNLIKDMFNLHEVKYYPDSYAKNIPLAEEFLGKNTVLELLNKEGTKSPFEIPIKFYYKSIMKNFIYDKTTYITSILLKKTNSKLIIPEYIHEIIHTQLETQKGLITNYHNREVISIFIEYLSSLNLDKTEILLNLNKINRNLDLLYAIDCLIDNSDKYQTKLEASIYISSTLKAEKLFNLYINSNNNIKKEILNSIQKVIDGNIILEDLLNKYDINLVSSIKETKTNIKKLQLGV